MKFRTTDHLGSTRLVTRADGTIDERGCLDFFPFGERMSDAVGGRGSIACYSSPTGGSQDAFSQQFTGKERDEESNLDYFLARYYAGTLGRFNSADAPFVGQAPSAPQSWNLYRYVQNNPLRHIDPDGNCGSYNRKLWMNEGEGGVS